MHANSDPNAPSFTDGRAAIRPRQEPRAVSLPDGSEILNKAEVARRLGVTERHIEYLIKVRRIPHLRLGVKALRFLWADVVRELSIGGGSGPAARG